MAEKKSFLRKLKPICFGFVLSALFITFLIIVSVTETITTDVRSTFTDNLVNKCSEVGFVDVQLERCIQKSTMGGTFKSIKVEDCGGCGKTAFGEDQLCLIGEDKDFCEENLSQSSWLIKIGAKIDAITKPITQLSIFTKGIIVALLFISGLLLR